MAMAKRVMVSGVRVVICLAAMAFVVASISLNDRVGLRDGRELVGSISEDAQMLSITTGFGTETIGLSEVAVDAKGSPQIEYGLRTALSQSSGSLLLLAIAVFAGVPLLQGVRLRMVMASENVHLGLNEAVRISLAGNFLNFAAPLGSTAGDVYKAYAVSRQTSRKTEAMTIVFLDRVLGLVCLLATVSLVTVLSPAGSRLAPFRTSMLVMLGAGTVGAMMYFSPRVRSMTWLSELMARLPLADQIRRIDSAVVALCRQRRIMVNAVLTTIVLQILAAGTFFLIARAIGMDARLASSIEYYAYFSTGEMVKALPGPPQGLGTMELAYRFLFGPFGSASQILCAAFAIRVVMLICSLPGVVVVWFGTPRSVVPRSDASLDAAVVPVR